VTDVDLIAALSPIQRVALTLWGEARGQREDLDHDGRPDLVEGIASAILNRVKQQHPHWGKTADEVCLMPRQFSCWNAGADRNHQAVLDAARHLLRGDPVGPILRNCLAIAVEVCTGTLQDAVHRATHYFTPAAMVPRGAVPSWAHGLKPVAVIDGTQFYAGVL
jgi:hypothetical protein